VDAHQHPVAISTEQQGSKTDWPTFLAVLTQMGAVLGTMMDGLHSSKALQVCRELWLLFQFC